MLSLLAKFVVVALIFTESASGLGAAANGVDCVGAWSRCDSKCKRVFVVSTPAADGGPNCTYEDGEVEKCSYGQDDCESVGQKIARNSHTTLTEAMAYRDYIRLVSNFFSVIGVWLLIGMFGYSVVWTYAHRDMHNGPLFGLYAVPDMGTNTAWGLLVAGLLWGIDMALHQLEGVMWTNRGPIGNGIDSLLDSTTVAAADTGSLITQIQDGLKVLESATTNATRVYKQELYPLQEQIYFKSANFSKAMDDISVTASRLQDALKQRNQEVGDQFSQTNDVEESLRDAKLLQTGKELKYPARTPKMEKAIALLKRPHPNADILIDEVGKMLGNDDPEQ